MIEQNEHRVIGQPQEFITSNMKTVICHFYNEEFLLPWWLNHHKHVFDHGIMIDYHSTDNSMKIIREICPNWEIRYTKNKYFDSAPIDEEVMNIEKVLGGWRMALNVTEFLYGNTDHLTELSEPKQYFIPNYVFIDQQNIERGQTILDHRYPLHQQRYWGYDEFANNGNERAGETMGRMNRSIHNYPVTYPTGRHFGGDPIYNKSFDDLVIFYYGWADLNDTGVKRKDQIKHKTTESGGIHGKTADQIIATGKNLIPHARDLRAEIAPILEHNRRITGQEF
jgi:hypothetical protein